MTRGGDDDTFSARGGGSRRGSRRRPYAHDEPQETRTPSTPPAETPEAVEASQGHEDPYRPRRRRRWSRQKGYAGSTGYRPAHAAEPRQGPGHEGPADEGFDYDGPDHQDPDSDYAAPDYADPDHKDAEHADLGHEELKPDGREPDGREPDGREHGGLEHDDLEHEVVERRRAARRRERAGGLLVALLAIVATGLAVAVVLTYLDLRALRQREADGAAALAAARSYAGDMLAYDHRHIEADLARARGHATDRLAGYYTQLAATLIPQVRREQTVQQVTVAGAAVESATADRVRVLMLVNRTTSKLPPGHQSRKSEVSQGRVRFVMVKRDGAWLVDDLSTLLGNPPTRT